MSKLRPMKPANAPDDLSEVQFPCFVSPKIDGIRCIINPEGVPVSNTLKPIRNRTIHKTLHDHAPVGLDGELVVGDPAASDTMRNTSSAVMSFDKDPGEWKYYVFDYWCRNFSYARTVNQLPQKLKANKTLPSNIEWLPHALCYSWQGLEDFEQHWLDQGFEGVIVRGFDNAYKHGRSTVREGGMMKLKRFTQAEAVVVGFEPLYHNANEATIDERGYTKRSTHQENKIPLDTLGVLICEGNNPLDKRAKPERITIRIGTGLTADERDFLWTTRESLVGKFVSYKFFPKGVKDLPRHPIFVSFRDPEDM